MIKVEHIQASICGVTGSRIDTLVCEYPRVIHAQLLTHRVFSKNSSSTRAIPLEKAIEQIEQNPVNYVWTLNQSGMQGSLANAEQASTYENIFNIAKTFAIGGARALVREGAHKQNAGRLLEPFQNIKIVLTSTEWENWDWLRDHGDAQGEIAELARAISNARKEAEPMVLNPGELHVPFVYRERAENGTLKYGNSLIVMPGQNRNRLAVISPEEALLVSMSVCAQTSYRNSDYSLDKAIVMRGRLLDTDHVHASPSEHQAIGLPYAKVASDDFLTMLFNLPEGVTHIDRKGNLWSGNFKGFIQHRQLIKGHDYALRDK